MESRTLDINIKKARDLKNVNLFTTMDVYAVVSISGDPRRTSEQKTPLAKHSGSDPHWNHRPMRFMIDESVAQSNRLNLEIEFVSNRILGDRKIGKVSVPIKQLIDENGGLDEGKLERIVNFSVRTSSGKEKGTVQFSYKFGGKYTVQAPPPLSPPLSPPLTSYAHSAPPLGYGYTPAGFKYTVRAPPPLSPQLKAYTYPAPPLGYGYAPAGFTYGGNGDRL